MSAITKERIELFIKNQLDNGLTYDGQVELARVALASLETKPISQTHNLPELIEGMEVSININTCSTDLSNHCLDTITEALKPDTAKNSYILLAQDAEPDFDVNGNSPRTPDSRISHGDRMPERGQNVLISANFDSSLVEPLICSAYYAGNISRRGNVTIEPGNGIE